MEPPNDPVRLPSPSAARPAGSWPTPLTPLVGRDAEGAAAQALLERPDIRLVTLVGPGGVGKTRLALQVLETAAVDFPGGTWFVPLAAVHEPNLVLPAIAQALGVRESGRGSLAEGIGRALGDDTVLLVLDNFEHVVAAAPLVAALLAASPRLTCLVTSRAPLRIAGEHASPVPTLPLPAPGDATTAARASLSPAVQLFVRRAGAARPDFTLTDANAAEIAAICRSLDGLPLALELAAARVRHLTIGALAERLAAAKPGGALGMLVHGPRDAPGRQQTLRDTIAWSHDLLTPAEQRVFRRLAVFVGGFTLEAAASVATAHAGPALDVIEPITALVDQSLLQLDAASGTSRYAMLTTVREFALEQLAASDEAARTHDAHAAHFRALAERAVAHLQGEQQPAWLARLQTEHPNLRAALTWSEQTEDVVGSLRLAAALWRFWHRRGYWEEGRGWLRRTLALAAAAPNPPPAAYAAVLTGAGWLAHYQNDFAAAATLLAAAAAGLRPDGRSAGLIDVLRGQALVAQSLGDQRRAAELGEEALACARRVGDEAQIADALCALSLATRELGDYPRATALAREAVERQQNGKNRGGVARALLVLGDVARDLGDPAAAQRAGEASLTLFQELGEPLGEGFSLHNLAVAAELAGDLALARAQGEASLAIFRRRDVQGATAEALVSLGWIVAGLGEPASALAHLTEAVRLAERVGPRWVVAAALEGIAAVAAGQRQQLVAGELAGLAAALRAQLGVPVRPHRRAVLDRTLGAVRLALGNAAYAAAWTRGTERSLVDAVAMATTVPIGTPNPAAPPAGLTPREVAVLRELAAGHRNQEIGARLFITPATVARHLANVYAKLGVDSRAKAVAYAHRHDLA